MEKEIVHPHFMQPNLRKLPKYNSKAIFKLDSFFVKKNWRFSILKIHMPII